MQIDPKDAAALYDRHAAHWAGLRAGSVMEHGWLDRFRALIPESPSVLDIGCGSGEPVARYLVDRGCTVTGVDAAPQLVAIAKTRVPEATCLVADLRGLSLGKTYDGILAWNSSFHLPPDDQRAMFASFAAHAAEGAALMFTTGTSHGEITGELNGDTIYYASLDADEYRALLDQHGFTLVDHVIEDPDCGQHTVWLARFDGSLLAF